MDRRRLVEAVSLLLAMIYTLLFPVLPLYARQGGADGWLIGMILGIPVLISVVMTYVWGAISDAIHSRISVLRSTLLAGSCLFFVFPYLDPWLLLLGRSLQMAFLAGAAVLLPAMIADDPKGHIGRELGTFYIAGGVGGIVGGALYAGLGGDEGAWPILFWVMGACGLAATAVTFTVRLRAHGTAAQGLRVLLHPPGAASSFFRGVAVALRQEVRGRGAPRRHPGVASRLALLSCILWTGNNAIFSVIPLYFEELGLGATEMGLMLVATAGLGIAGSWWSGRLTERHDRRRVILVAMLCYAATYTVYAGPAFPLLLAFAFALPIALFHIVPSTAMLVDHSAPTHHGRDVGRFQAALGLGGFLGPLAGGFLWELGLGLVPAVFLACGTMFVAQLLTAGLPANAPGSSNGAQRPAGPA